MTEPLTLSEHILQAKARLELRFQELEKLLAEDLAAAAVKTKTVTQADPPKP